MTAAPIEIGLVGIGKIARDQHIPVIRANDAFRLTCAASRHAMPDSLNTYPTLEAMLAAEPTLAAVAICTPPQARFETAAAALEAGKHVLLEKPPGATVGEVAMLEALADKAGVTLLASWHSRFATCVAPAKAWLEGRRVRSVQIDWREDVRHWHPGQAWIWEPGGLGVFDPGINALSIATEILPEPMRLTEALLEVPANRQAPIAARLGFRDRHGAPVEAVFDWRETGEQTWEIRVRTDGGELRLVDGGARLFIDGEVQRSTVAVDNPHTEYIGVYRRFAERIASGRSEVDVRPLRHVADAFLIGRREATAAFDD